MKIIVFITPTICLSCDEEAALGYTTYCDATTVMKCCDLYRMLYIANCNLDYAILISLNIYRRVNSAPIK